jgi:glutathione S-transferase
MTGSITLYTNPMSRGRIVRWMLEEIGCPYNTELVEYGAAMHGESFRAVNPMAKVPALRDGDTIVTECGAICAYLADRFPDSRLAPPAGDSRRGVYYRWMFFAAGPFEAAVTNKSLGVAVPKEREGMVGYGSFERVMAAAEQAVSASDYVLGDQFSAADVYFGSQIGFGLRFGSIEKRPAFEHYWNRICQRPAHLRAAAIDDALLPKSEAR